MRVWLITLGEPLPIDGPRTRLLRTGYLSRTLSRRGHQVTWFTNRFDHFAKVHRPGPDVQQISERERLVLLRSRGYESNVSVGRFMDHRDLVKDFRARVSRLENPDIIVASMPTIDLCEAAVSFGHQVGVPTVVDIRDLWPDSIWHLAPAALRPIMKIITSPLEAQLRSALRKTTALTSHVEAFVDWARRKVGDGAAKRGQVFPLGYEPFHFGADTAQARQYWATRGLDLSGNDFLVVYAGTISRQCEFGHVVEAAHAMAAEPVQFVLCGAGDMLHELQSAAASLTNMLVPGWCTHSQLGVLLAKAGAGLMPYRRLPNFVGAIPNKALEYMAWGVPIVWRLEDGVLANLLRTERIGVTYDATAEGLVGALREIRQSGEDAGVAAARSRAVFNERFQAAAVYAAMAFFLESLVLTELGR